MGIEKEILELVTTRGEIWADAMKEVIMSHSAKQTAEIMVKYAKLLGKTPEALATYLDMAFSKPDEYVVPLMKDYGKYSTTADKYGEKALEVHHSKVLATLYTATAGITPTMGAAAIKGTAVALIKGLVLVGALVLAGVVVYYGFGYLGELTADDPIEPTWLGDPEERAAWEAEQAAHVVTYGDVIAIDDDGIDVTDVFFDEPVYLYMDWEKHPHLYIFVDYIPTWGEGAKEYGVSDDRTRTVFNDVSSDGCPYYTYGEVCVDLISKKGKHMYLLEFDEPCGRKAIHCKTNS